MSRSLPTLAFLPLIFWLVACGGAAEPLAEAAAERLENADLKIALARIPEPFVVESNTGEGLVLVAPGPAGDGRASFAMGPIEFGGINLVAAVQAKKAEFEAGGTYFGNRELGTPIGTAFTARGAWPRPEGEVEEIWVFAVHPEENRLLTLTFTYPTGESQERVNQLMELFGEVEGVSAGG